MYSSKMRTVRNSNRLLGGMPGPGGMSAPGGVPGHGGMPGLRG